MTPSLEGNRDYHVAMVTFACSVAAQSKRFSNTEKQTYFFVLLSCSRPVLPDTLKALEGVTAFSTVPLRLTTVVGFIVSFVSFLLGAWALLAAFFSPSVVPG
jgi:hypothetical protein